MQRILFENSNAKRWLKFFVGDACGDDVTRRTEGEGAGRGEGEDTKVGRILLGVVLCAAVFDRGRD